MKSINCQLNFMEFLVDFGVHHLSPLIQLCYAGFFAANNVQCWNLIKEILQRTDRGNYDYTKVYLVVQQNQPKHWQCNSFSIRSLNGDFLLSNTTSSNLISSPFLNTNEPATLIKYTNFKNFRIK